MFLRGWFVDACTTENATHWVMWTHDKKSSTNGLKSYAWASNAMDRLRNRTNWNAQRLWCTSSRGTINFWTKTRTWIHNTCNNFGRKIALFYRPVLQSSLAVSVGTSYPSWIFSSCVSEWNQLSWGRITRTGFDSFRESKRGTVNFSMEEAQFGISKRWCIHSAYRMVSEDNPLPHSLIGQLCSTNQKESVEIDAQLLTILFKIYLAFGK